MNADTHSGDRDVSMTVPAAQAMAAAPVGEGERINAMDSARGFALLGILMVNMTYFSEPLGRALDPAPKEGSTGLDRFANLFVTAICEGKFFTLFSTLFGMGLTIQFLRAQQRGEAFTGRGLRRLLFLGSIGLGHALLLWYGDILFLYALCGLVMLFVVKWKAKSLAILGAILLGFSALSAGCFGGFGAWGQQQEAKAKLAASEAKPDEKVEASPSGETAEALKAEGTGAAGEAASVQAAGEPVGPPAWEDPAKTPIQRFLAAAEAGKIGDPTSNSLWMDLETEAYRDGPASSAFAFRAMTWGFLLIITLLAGFGGMILGMFALGSALLKWGVFEKGKAALAGRLALVGLGVGWPAGVLAVWMLQDNMSIPRLGLGSALQVIAGVFAAIGTLSLFAVAWHRGWAMGVLRALANAGRMAMTNYLTQTLVCTFIFYWWGLGKFGTFSDSDKFLLALGIWSAQLVISAAWLRYFRMGPMEWVWRCATYMKAQPFRR
jgi:uncharacterized protein